MEKLLSGFRGQGLCVDALRSRGRSLGGDHLLLLRRGRRRWDWGGRLQRQHKFHHGTHQMEALFTHPEKKEKKKEEYYHMQPCNIRGRNYRTFAHENHARNWRQTLMLKVRWYFLFLSRMSVGKTICWRAWPCCPGRETRALPPRKGLGRVSL